MTPQMLRRHRTRTPWIHPNLMADSPPLEKTTSWCLLCDGTRFESRKNQEVRNQSFKQSTFLLFFHVLSLSALFFSQRKSIFNLYPTVTTDIIFLTR